MVAGTGMMATAFKKYWNDHETIIFASGVSDSKNCKEDDFYREKQLLKSALVKNWEKTFVYFGTCLVEDNHSIGNPYVHHKTQMEEIIKRQCAKWLIFRLPNVVGKTHNTTTLIPYLYNAIFSGTRIDLWVNAKRNVIDVDDVFKVCDHFINNKMFNNTVSIANPLNYSIQFIVECIEKHCGKTLLFNPKHRGVEFDINVKPVEHIYRELGITFPWLTYLPEALKKHYL